MRKKIFSAILLSMLAFASTSTLVSCKDYDDDISANTTAINDLKGKLTELQTNLSSQISSLQTQLTTAKNELQTAIDKKADKTTVETLAGRVTTLEQQVGVLESKIASLESVKADKSDVEAKYLAVTGGADVDLKTINLKTLDAAIKENLRIQNEAIETAKGRITALETMLTDYPTVKAQVATNKANIEALTPKVNKAVEDIDDLYEKYKKITDKVLPAVYDYYDGEISKLNTAINGVSTNINALTLLVKNRLTSMVYLPTFYINGIEAIAFNTLEYQDWGLKPENWEANAPAVENEVLTISNDETTAKYLLNPTLANVDGYEFDVISSKATNYNTRANANDIVSVSKCAYENGELTVNLKKEKAGAFENDINPGLFVYGSTFDIIALRAKLPANALAEGEENAYVYSDWARLIETSGRPQIHRATESAADFAKAGHFLRYSEVYNENYLASGEQGPATKASLYSRTKTDLGYLDKGTIHLGPWNFDYWTWEKGIPVEKEVKWDESLDLKTLVAVCLNDEAEVDYESYNLDFEFNLIDFNIKDQNQTIEICTNQSKYANIEGSVITSRGVIKTADKYESTDTPNKAAIGRTPMIQVVLKDKKNNKVVDVQYFRIIWTDPAEDVITDVETTIQQGITSNYTCQALDKLGDIFSVEPYYTVRNMSNTEFRNNYGYATGGAIYTDVKLKNGAPTGKKIGSATYRQGMIGNSTSDQIQYEFDIVAALGCENYEAADAKIKELMLANNGEYTITGYILLAPNFFSAPKLAVPVTITIKHDMTKYTPADYKNGVGQYIQSVWSGETTKANINKYVTCSVVPYEAVPANKTTTIGHDVATSFIDNGVAYSTGNYETMFNDKTVDVDLVFDAARASELPALGDYLKGYSWKVENKAIWATNGTASILAAKIEGTVVSLVKEVNTADDGDLNAVLTTAARILLGNKVAVKFAATYNTICDNNAGKVDVDKFMVYFEKPLEYSATDAGKIDLVDQTEKGNSAKFDITTLFSVKECWGNNKNTVYPQSDGKIKKMYGVGEPTMKKGAEVTIDGVKYYVLDEAKTNLQKDGSIGTTCNVLLSELLNADKSVKYQVLWNGVVGANGKIIFFQKTTGGSTETLSKDMKVEVPAYLAGKFFLTTEKVNNTIVSNLTINVAPKQTAKATR